MTSSGNSAVADVIGYIKRRSCRSRVGPDPQKKIPYEKKAQGEAMRSAKAETAVIQLQAKGARDGWHTTKS